MFAGWRCRETHSANLAVIQTRLTHRFYLAASDENSAFVPFGDCPLDRQDISVGMSSSNSFLPTRFARFHNARQVRDEVGKQLGLGGNPEFRVYVLAMDLDRPGGDVKLATDGIG